MEFTNCGQCPLEKLHVASPSSEFYSFGSVDLNEENPNSSPQEGENCTIPQDGPPPPASDIKRVCGVPIPGGHLSPGSSVKLPVWVQGNEKSGTHQHQLLFYYESVDKNSKMRYCAELGSIKFLL